MDKSREQSINTRAVLSLLSLFHSVPGPTHEVVLPTSRWIFSPPNNPTKKSPPRQAHESSEQLLRDVPRDLTHISVFQVKTLRLESFWNLPKLATTKL